MRTLAPLPVQSPQSIQDEIYAVIAEPLGLLLDAVYNFRYQPNAATGLTKLASLTSVGEIPMNTSENDNFYDYILMAVVRHDGSLEGLEEAERIINAVPTFVWNALSVANMTTCREIYPPRQSVKPGAPEGSVNWRSVYIYIRARV